jgi:exodeoxyribonuclease V alpha subunit
MSSLRQLLAAGQLRPIDVQAARLLERLNGDNCPELLVVAALASRATGLGHTCLPLSTVSTALTEADMDGTAFADVAALQRMLLHTAVVGRPGETRPLILDQMDNLYLLRFFRYEQRIAQALRKRSIGIETIAADTAETLLDQLFSGEALQSKAIDWQRTAAALALLKRFVVISGGPGTGKTYTVARILALQALLSTKKLRIGLAAPTGKAALRLQESIRAAKTTLPPSMAEHIPDHAQTLHRLLGFQSVRPGFLYNSGNRLHLDLLILDEASMIDVPLMAAILAALPETCNVILLGDRDQLASVEAGNLFGDICGSDAPQWSAALIAQLQSLSGFTFPGTPATDLSDPLADSLVLLHTSHRFRERSGISALSRAVNSGAADALEETFRQRFSDLHIEEPTDPMQTIWLGEQIDAFFTPIFNATSPQSALRELNRRRILCALREGPSGVTGINQLAETVFRRKGYLTHGERSYQGMPIIILRNDYSLHLFNGDTGILWPDARGLLQAWFAGEDNTIRSVNLARLPAWQASYAITVHKSQGSEFKEVLLILPRENVQILSRELLYTGITRARERLILYGRKDLLIRAAQRRIIRYSGLREKLRQHSANPGLAA